MQKDRCVCCAAAGGTHLIPVSRDFAGCVLGPGGRSRHAVKGCERSLSRPQGVDLKQGPWGLKSGLPGGGLLAGPTRR